MADAPNMAARLLYVAAATNRFSQAADIYTLSDSSSNATCPSLVAFGSSKLVALWDLDNEQQRGISETLPGSTGLITCVKFLAQDTIVAVNDAGVLTIWRHRANSQAGTAFSTPLARG
ncbi:hypothetical protein D9619_000370 [Psilocybe cf. subviscida]|uniref:Uncharacterized protein n=1 Tax=Psilocybe cf. subviscida TaxID=2480587 RepID=A0A8H5BIN2_9AGAR|nr:hypothetical protein D9619_000370 [Psilocybe cf. subviscida]